MKKLLLLGVLMVATKLIAEAQPGGPPPPPPDMEAKKEQVEAMKIGYISTKLELTSQEAQVFWPVYNEYSAEMDKLRENRRKEMRKGSTSLDELSDAELEKVADGEIAFRQAELDIMKKYHGQFKQVLPIKKVAQLYRAEEDFKRELLRKLQQQRTRNDQHKKSK